MSKALLDVINSYLVKHGSDGKADLCKATGKSEQTISRWLKKGVPTAHDAFKLALACGLEEEEALQLAKDECSSTGARTA